MNPSHPQPNKPRLAIALGVVTIIAIGFALFEFSSAQNSEESLAAANRLHQSDLAREQELAEKVAAAEQAKAQLNAQLAEQRIAADMARTTSATQGGARSASGSAPGATAADTARKKAREDGKAFIAMFGEQAKPMLLTIGRAQVERNFSNLIRSGALTPAQIDDLETATAEHWIDSIEVGPNTMHPGDPNLSDDEVRALLGDDGFKSFQDAKRLQPLQGAVNDISSMSVFVPFTPEQSKQLLQVVASASSAYQSGDKVTPQSIDWNQVISQSQSFLSPAQLNAVKAEAQLPQLMTLVKQFYQTQPQPSQPPKK